MACSLNFPLSEVCTADRFGLPVKGVPGRGSCQPLAFVIHRLPMAMAQYDLEVGRPIAATHYYTVPPTPRSVHMLFAGTGVAHQYVKPEDVAWGINGLSDPTADALAAICDTAYPDRSLIHLAFDSAGATPDAIRSMANAICCWALKFNIPVDAAHVLDAADFNDGEDALGGVPLQLIQDAAACVQAGGALPPADPIPPGLGATIQQLIACCNTNTAAIAQLSADLDALSAWKAATVAELAALQTTVAALQSCCAQLDTIPAINGQIADLLSCVNTIKACTDRLCPDPCATGDCYDIHYQLAGSASKQVITPNAPVRINASTKIDDAPAPLTQVVAGPLWTARLECACNWTVAVTAQLAMGEWCAGKKVWIDMVSCSGRVRVAEWTSTGGPSAPVLSGNGVVVVPPAPCTVYFEIGTDDTTAPLRTLEYADVQLTC